MAGNCNFVQSSATRHSGNAPSVSQHQVQLEQLERLRSEDTPRRLMITQTIESYWIPSKKNYRSRTENVTERIRFSKSGSNDLADIGQGQRSSHATHLLMLVIICTKYGKNASRIVDFFFQSERRKINFRILL